MRREALGEGAKTTVIYLEGDRIKLIPVGEVGLHRPVPSKMFPAGMTLGVGVGGGQT